MCVCVCVCVCLGWRGRRREREEKGQKQIEKKTVLLLQEYHIVHMYFRATSAFFFKLMYLAAWGEDNGNPLQYLCLENPMDGGAWQAAVRGVAQSWTRLKRLSSSSSIWLHGVFVAVSRIFTVSFGSLGYLVAMCGLNCMWAYGVLVPLSGMKPGSLALQARFFFFFSSFIYLFYFTILYWFCHPSQILNQWTTKEVLTPASEVTSREPNGRNCGKLSTRVLFFFF